MTIDAALLAAVTALAAGWLGGLPALLGVLAGGALALGDFWWLAARIDAAGTGATTPTVALWGATAGLRLAAVAVAVAGLFVTGWFHPVALVVGLSALPCALVARGLRVAREGA
ncbi:MAG: ATP synthase subunit I [Candidatus Rokubacteria bacterium]|nr:ATP synthase subunit I [Candidatus Rokubacteria bacterium]